MNLRIIIKRDRIKFLCDSSRVANQTSENVIIFVVRFRDVLVFNFDKKIIAFEIILELIFV
jgi:hypothetical protein